MVHGLRLFWFVLYGSYPEGHAHLAQGLRGEYGAKANWTIDRLREARKRLSATAFQSLLRQEFNAPTLADQVPLMGGMFEAGRILRNDSNYESLISAHQYFHGGVEVHRVHVPDEMARTAETMSKGSQLVLQYLTRIIGCVFRNDRPWAGIGSPYTGADLKALLLRYVRDKIESASNGQRPDASVLTDWFQGLPELMQDIMRAESNSDNPAHELVDCIRYTVFQGKQNLMQGFQEEATRLALAVDRITSGGTL
jgi:hypothetical protein